MRIAACPLRWVSVTPPFEQWASRTFGVLKACEKDADRWVATFPLLYRFRKFLASGLLSLMTGVSAGSCGTSRFDGPIRRVPGVVNMPMEEF